MCLAPIQRTVFSGTRTGRVKLDTHPTFTTPCWSLGWEAGTQVLGCQVLPQMPRGDSSWWNGHGVKPAWMWMASGWRGGWTPGPARPSLLYGDPLTTFLGRFWKPREGRQGRMKA